MDIEPHNTLWALLDKAGLYKGGIRTSGKPPSEVGENPEGYTEVQVSRFPKGYETHYDVNTKKWSSNPDARAEMEYIALLRNATPEEFAKLVQAEIQKWFLKILPELLPTKLNAEQIARLFPLVEGKGKKSE